MAALAMALALGPASARAASPADDWAFEMRRAVPVIEATSGPDSTKLAGALVALGLVQVRPGRLDQAHPRVAGVLENLAGLELASGRYAAAAQFSRALAIKEGAYGDQSPELLETLESYALALTYLDRPADAGALDARAAAIRDRLGGIP